MTSTTATTTTTHSAQGTTDKRAGGGVTSTTTTMTHPAQGTEPATPDHTVHAGVVVQSIHYVSSYNFQHFSTCIFGVFPSSIAQRHQLMGRILRLGQERPMVIYKKLVPINTILSVLDERHERGDAVQSTFQSRSSHVDAIVA